MFKIFICKLQKYPTFERPQDFKTYLLVCYFLLVL